MEDVRLQVQERMDIKERAHDFRFTFGDDGDDDQVCCSCAKSAGNACLGQAGGGALSVWNSHLPHRAWAGILHALKNTGERGRLFVAYPPGKVERSVYPMGSRRDT